MTRRDFVQLPAAAPLATVGSAAQPRAPKTGGPPNIVFILADQMTPFMTCPYGQKIAITPNLDRLAAGGTLFESAYCNSPLCVPSRTSMFSGRLPAAVAAYDNASEFPAHVPTFLHYQHDQGDNYVESRHQHDEGQNYEHRRLLEFEGAEEVPVHVFPGSGPERIAESFLNAGPQRGRRVDVIHRYLDARYSVAHLKEFLGLGKPHVYQIGIKFIHPRLENAHDPEILHPGNGPYGSALP